MNTNARGSDASLSARLNWEKGRQAAGFLWRLERGPGSVYPASSKDMSYWPVYKWTLWIHRQREYSSVSLASGLSPLSESKHRPYWHTEEIEDESKGRGQNRRSKVETTTGALKRLPSVREGGRRDISILPWDRGEIFRSSKTRKIATVSTGRDDDETMRATKLGKESFAPSPRTFLHHRWNWRDLLHRCHHRLPTYLWNNG